MHKYVLLVHRSEATGHVDSPFDGIEVYGIYDTEEEADSAIDNAVQNEDGSGWKWHIEPHQSKPPRVHVVQYQVSREYGGAEEGGWWYDWYEDPVLIATADKEGDASNLARLLNEQEKASRKENREHDRFSMLGGADTVFIAEAEVGSQVRAEHPRYE